MKRVSAHWWKRADGDHYVEPSWCSARLFDEEEFIGTIQDPACGFGTIVKSAVAAGHAAFGTDIADRGFAGQRRTGDFLEQRSRVANVVTNAPFNVARQFALHALELATGKVAMIFPTARLNAAHWIAGTPLRRIWLLSPRPSMPPGHVIASGGKVGGGKMDFCWLVWERGYRGLPDLAWLYRDPPLVRLSKGRA